MDDVQSPLLLLLGLAAVTCSAALVVTCMHVKSVLDFALGTYVVAWSLVVALCLGLSPTKSLTTRSTLIGVAAILGASLLVWQLCGRPRPRNRRPALARVREALGDRLVFFLGIVIALAFAYSIALAFLTPINDGDALAYHLARSAFWYQGDGVGYIGGAVDSRLNGNPPNAEIGTLFTMLLAGGDRFAALPQLGAYITLIVCAVGLGLRAGLDVREALFGGFLLGSLPVVVVQASAGLNDLVVAAFLGAAAYFAVRPTRPGLALLALAIALALGTKFTAVIALPVLVAVIAVGRPRRDWPAAGLATVVGIALGSIWYAVNEIDSGTLDGGLADQFGQRADVSPSAFTVTLMRLLLDTVDLSGTPRPFVAAYLVVGAAMVVVAIVLRARRRRAASLAVGGLLVIATLVIYPAFGVVQDVVFRGWAALGRPSTPAFELGWNLNVVADPALSWFGPLGALLFVGCAGSIVLWRRHVVTPLVVVFASAPLALLVTLAALVVWDPFRGRLVIFGVALAAATWGLLLRWRALAIGAVGIASVSTVASMLNYQGKPSGIGVLLDVPNPFHVSVDSVWTAPRADVQAWTRPNFPEQRDVFRFVEASIPDDARVALAPRVNDFVSPYFGRRLSRPTVLVRDRGTVPKLAEWLVIAPSTHVARCPGSWKTELELESGWLIARRNAPDACPAMSHSAH
jgi:hypothetical protein